MSTTILSTKGQVVLPIETRRRLGLVTGTYLRVFEEPNGVRLVITPPVSATTIQECAGMVTAPSKGKPRHLKDINPAMLVDKADE